ncbi:MAG: VOC family protein [Acetobacterium sp.]
MKFSWVTVMVVNMDESIKFYTEIVGLAVNNRMKAGPGIELGFLGDGETEIELVCHESNNEVSFGNDISLGFEVSSMDETLAMVNKNGIAIHSGPFQPNPHIKFFYITDPNGLKIQFIEKL